MHTGLQIIGVIALVHAYNEFKESEIPLHVRMLMLHAWMSVRSIAAFVWTMAPHIWAESGLHAVAILDWLEANWKTAGATFVIAWVLLLYVAMVGVFVKRFIRSFQGIRNYASGVADDTRRRIWFFLRHLNPIFVYKFYSVHRVVVPVKPVHSDGLDSFQRPDGVDPGRWAEEMATNNKSRISSKKIPILTFVDRDGDAIGLGCVVAHKARVCIQTVFHVLRAAEIDGEFLLQALNGVTVSLDANAIPFAAWRRYKDGDGLVYLDITKDWIYLQGSWSSPKPLELGFIDKEIVSVYKIVGRQLHQGVTKLTQGVGGVAYHNASTAPGDSGAPLLSGNRCIGAHRGSDCRSLTLPGNVAFVNAPPPRKRVKEENKPNGVSEYVKFGDTWKYQDVFVDELTWEEKKKEYLEDFDRYEEYGMEDPDYDEALEVYLQDRTRFVREIERDDEVEAGHHGGRNVAMSYREYQLRYGEDESAQKCVEPAAVASEVDDLLECTNEDGAVHGPSLNEVSSPVPGREDKKKRLGLLIGTKACLSLPMESSRTRSSTLDSSGMLAKRREELREKLLRLGDMRANALKPNQSQPQTSLESRLASQKCLATDRPIRVQKPPLVPSCSSVAESSTPSETLSVGKPKIECSKGGQQPTKSTKSSRKRSKSKKKGTTVTVDASLEDQEIAVGEEGN